MYVVFHFVEKKRKEIIPSAYTICVTNHISCQNGQCHFFLSFFIVMQALYALHFTITLEAYAITISNLLLIYSASSILFSIFHFYWFIELCLVFIIIKLNISFILFFYKFNVVCNLKCDDFLYVEQQQKKKKEMIIRFEM